jgi:hypothetical protein
VLLIGVISFRAKEKGDPFASCSSVQGNIAYYRNVDVLMLSRDVIVKNNYFKYCHTDQNF